MVKLKFHLEDEFDRFMIFIKPPGMQIFVRNHAFLGQLAYLKCKPNM